MNLLNRVKVVVATPILGNHIETVVELKLVSVRAATSDGGVSKTHAAIRVNHLC